MAKWQPIKTAPRDRFILIRGGSPDSGWDGGSYEGEPYNAYVVKSNPHLAGVPQFFPPCVVAKFECQKGEMQFWRFASYDSGFYGLWENPAEWCDLDFEPTAANVGV